MGKRSPVVKTAVGAAVGAVLGALMAKLGWLGPRSNGFHLDLGQDWVRVVPSSLLWVGFSLYWGIAAGNAAPTQRSESGGSTLFHRVALTTAVLLLFVPVPGLNAWFLPRKFHFLVAVGVGV